MNPNVFNNSGAVTDLFKALKDKSIHRFKSVYEIIDFKRNHRYEIEDVETKVKNEIAEDIFGLTDSNRILRNEYNECEKVM